MHILNFYIKNAQYKLHNQDIKSQLSKIKKKRFRDHEQNFDRCVCNYALICVELLKV